MAYSTSTEKQNINFLLKQYKDIIKNIIISNNIFEFEDITPKRNSESCFNPTFIHISPAFLRVMF